MSEQVKDALKEEKVTHSDRNKFFNAEIFQSH